MFPLTLGLNKKFKTYSLMPSVFVDPMLKQINSKPEPRPYSYHSGFVQELIVLMETLENELTHNHFSNNYKNSSI